MSLSRRQILNTGAASGAGIIAGVAALGAPASAKTGTKRHGHEDHRPAALFPPLQKSPGALLALPPGFSYTVVAVSGQTDVEDGAGNVVGKTPARPDGTVVLKTKTGYQLIQNHEISAGYGDTPIVPHVEGTVYDPGAEGGCTVLDVSSRAQRRKEWVGISGTEGNCAGGATPWGTWLTCEETEAKAGTGSFTKDHGYVFEVFPGGPEDQSPLPIEAWGRAPHEAVVIEPGKRRVYLTEDASRPTGLVYRWTAPSGYTLKAYIAKSLDKNAGTLEAMAVRAPDGSVLPDLAYATSAQIGRPFAVDWVTVPDRHAGATSLRKQFSDGQVTHSKKLEGAWGDETGMYFVSSFAFSRPDDLPADATQHDGQLWYYRYADQTLTLMAYFPYNPDLHSETLDPESGLGRSLDLAFDGPDNVHVTPYGTVVLAEDGNTANHLLSWTRETGTQAIARNLMVQEQNSSGQDVYSEMTGPCFSPDGKVLFANVQEPGHVFAITGPWEKYLG